MTVRIHGDGEIDGLQNFTSTDLTATNEVTSDSLKLQGATSGFSEITAPAVAGDQTFTLPATGGTLMVSGSGGGGGGTTVNYNGASAWGKCSYQMGRLTNGINVSVCSQNGIE